MAVVAGDYLKSESLFSDVTSDRGSPLQAEPLTLNYGICLGGNAGFKLQGSKVKQVYFPTRRYICGLFSMYPMDTFIMIQSQLNLNH